MEERGIMVGNYGGSGAAEREGESDTVRVPRKDERREGRSHQPQK